MLPKSYNARKPSESEKRHTRRVERQLRTQSPYGEHVVNHPERYVAATTRSGKQAKRLNRLGYTVKKTGKGYRVIERKGEGVTRVTIRKDDTISRRYKNRRVTSYPADREWTKIEARLQKFFANPKNRNRYITFKIGGAQPFNRVIYSLDDFYKYEPMIQRIFKNRAKDAPDLRPQLQIVEFDEDNEDNEDSDELPF